MRATGILRRIDELGRVVIPKEIRRSMRIKEGDALEIFVDNGFLCLRKYEAEKEFSAEIKALEDDILNQYFMTDNKDEINIIKMAFQEIRHQLRAIEEKGEEE
jgi:stage V sporulation protein T